MAKCSVKANGKSKIIVFCFFHRTNPMHGCAEGEKQHGKKKKKNKKPKSTNVTSDFTSLHGSEAV